MDFAVPADHWIKLKESEKRGKYQDLNRELKNPMNMKVIVILVVIDVLSTVIQGFVQKMENLEIRGGDRDHLTHKIVEVGQNT